MGKAILTTKPFGRYDDLPELRYHFPRTYLNQVERAVGDSIVYYEPRRTGITDQRSTGRQSYIALARIEHISADPGVEDHFYAHIVDYLPFDNPVPFRIGGTYPESILQRHDGATNKGAFGRAVRSIPDAEFETILALGFDTNLGDFIPDAPSSSESEAEMSEREQPTLERPLVETTLTRPFRDKAFSRQVRHAYDRRCALTGLRLINGGGNPEVQAAHIRPVAHNGTDSVRNGLALSATVHWMFDRGLVAIDDDFRILTGDLPGEMKRLLNVSGIATVPERPDLQPHPQFLHYHRENIFKG